MKVLSIIGKNLGVIVLAVVVLVTGQAVQLGLEKLFSNDYLKYIIPCIIRVIVTFVLTWGVSSKLLKISPDELGLKPERFDPKMIIVSVAMPLVVLAFYIFVLPGNEYIAKEGMLGQSVVYGIFAEGLAAGFTEEMTFRGMIFRYMKKTMSVRAAVILQALLFGVVHIVNLSGFDLTDVILTVLSGSSVAVLFSLMALKSGTVYPGTLAHGIWNALIIGGIFGIGDIVNGQKNDSYMIIPVESGSKLLSGGQFGVEGAVPGIICYIAAAIFVFLTCKATKSKTADNSIE